MVLVNHDLSNLHAWLRAGGIMALMGGLPGLGLFAAIGAGALAFAVARVAVLDRNLQGDTYDY